MVQTTTNVLQLQNVTVTGGGNINFTSGTQDVTFTEEAHDDLAAETSWAQNFLSDPAFVPTEANIFGDVDGAGGTEFMTLNGVDYQYDYLGYQEATYTDDTGSDSTGTFGFIYVPSTDKTYAINLTTSADPANGSSGLNLTDLVNDVLYVGETVVLPCFTSGTLVQTSKGEVVIDDLAVGDLIETFEHGRQRIIWIGSTTLSPSHLALNPQHIPIVIPKNGLGNGVPKRDLRVSPQHRVLIQSHAGRILFDESNLLVKAKDLACGRRQRSNDHGVTYWHIMFENHECVYTEGMISESFNPSVKNIAMFDKGTRDEFLELFSELMNSQSEQLDDCFLGLKAYEYQALVAFDS